MQRGGGEVIVLEQNQGLLVTRGGGLLGEAPIDRLVGLVECGDLVASEIVDVQLVP